MGGAVSADAARGRYCLLSIVDEGRKINLNSMVQNSAPNLAAIQKVQRLFAMLDVSPDLVQGIIDWITPNNGTGLGGGIGDYYAGLQTSLSAALRRDADDGRFADGQRLQRGNLQSRQPVFDCDGRDCGECQYRSAASAGGARAGVDRGSETGAGVNRCARDSAVQPADRHREPSGPRATSARSS